MRAYMFVHGLGAQVSGTRDELLPFCTPRAPRPVRAESRPHATTASTRADTQLHAGRERNDAKNSRLIEEYRREVLSRRAIIIIPAC